MAHLRTLVLTLAAFLVSAAPLAGNTWSGSADVAATPSVEAPSDPEDSGSAGSTTGSSCPASLQRLVDRAPRGSRVVVGDCTFRETVRIQKPITLVTTGGRVDGERKRRHAFVVEANNVTLTGWEVTRTTNAAQDGAVRVVNSDRFTLRRARIHHTGGACISIVGGTGHQILESTLAYCAQQGFHLPRVTDTRVAFNRIHHNNPKRQFDPGWEAGGGKASNVDGLVFARNRVWANRGPGLWCDINCRDVVFRKNRVHHNENAGIYYEISKNAVITRNRVWENGWAFTPWGWGGGIVVSSSRNVMVRNNVVAWNADGISVISQNRGSTTWNRVEDVRVRDNFVFVAPQPSDGSDKFLLGWLQDWRGVMYNGASANRGAGNRYWHSQPEPTWARFGWDGAKSYLVHFLATPGESDARYISRSRMRAALEVVGMPRRPLAR
jgi:hypothetical protein